MTRKKLIGAALAVCLILSFVLIPASAATSVAFGPGNIFHGMLYPAGFSCSAWTGGHNARVSGSISHVTGVKYYLPPSTGTPDSQGTSGTSTYAPLQVVSYTGLHGAFTDDGNYCTANTSG